MNSVEATRQRKGTEISRVLSATLDAGWTNANVRTSPTGEKRIDWPAEVAALEDLGPFIQQMPRRYRDTCVHSSFNILYL